LQARGMNARKLCVPEIFLCLAGKGDIIDQCGPS